MKCKVRSCIKIISLGIGSIVALAILLTIVVNIFFKDQLIALVIEQLNKQIDARVKVDKVDFSLWRQFPNASVSFERVNAQSANKYISENHKTDTLLFADKIYLEFNLIKMVWGIYELRQITIRDGFVKLKIDKDGNENFNIIKSSGKPSNASLNLELNDLLLSNVFLSFEDDKSGFRMSGVTDRSRIRGNFKSRSFVLDIKSSMFTKQLTVNDEDYVVNKNMQLNARLQVNDSLFSIKNTEFTLENLPFEVNGIFCFGKKISMKLSAIGNRLEFNRILAILPNHIREKLNGYTGKGKVDLKLSVEGIIGKSTIPRVDAGFSFHNCSLIQKETGVKLKNIDLSGFYSNEFKGSPKTGVLRITQFTSELGDGKISGRFSVEDLSHPFFTVDCTYNLNLEDIKKFVYPENVSVLTGQIDGSLSMNASLPGFSSLQIADLSDFRCKGVVNVHQAGFKMKDSNHFFEQINGAVVMENDVLFRNISFKVHESDFLINGTLVDGFKYIFKQTKSVTLEADVRSKNLDLSKYFTTENQTTSSGKTNTYSREFLFPDNVNLDVKLYVDNFKLNRFKAQKITGYLNYKPKIFVLKSLSFETLTGKVSGNGAVLQDLYKNFVVKGQVDITRLNLQQMFYTFDNFSQDVLQDHHLRGKISGKIGVSAEWNNAFVFNKDKLIVDADLSIENGELIHFEPMYNLSRFISLDDLQNIRFSNLKNKIYIKDKQIIIPEMEVVSSAFDISASGNHLFDNHYNYKVKVLLSDVLWRKARKSKDENTEFGMVEDDGLGKTGIYLSIVGFNKDFKISYDSRQTVAQIKEGLKKQKAELKGLLKEEFGFYKKDSTVKVSKTASKSKFRVQWDEDDAHPKEESVQEKEVRKPERKTSEGTKVEFE